MAPMMIDPPIQVQNYSKPSRVCSDLTVVPSENASRRIKELWWLHGHPHSKRYSDPSLISLAALVRHDGSIYRGEKGFLYPISTDGSTPYKSMTWDEFDQITESLAALYASQLQTELQHANSSRHQPTLGLLGGGRTIEYFCTQLALQKLGVRVLLLAESNALSALHHLLKTCHAVAVITDSKNTTVDTNGLRKLEMVESLPNGSNVTSKDVDAVKFQDWGDVWERHTFIIHSSGSTGMPKPIIHTNRSMMLIARMYRLFQEVSVENWFLLFPLYHIAGISIALSGLPNGQILSFPPLVWPPASSTIFATWKTLSSMGHDVDTVHCAPTLIENMYDYITENGGDFTPLAFLKLLQPGGAALSDSIVNALTANGVNVKTTYGSTEIGPPFRSIPHTRDNPKCYSFRNLYPDNPHLQMEKVAEGTYECVVHKGFELAAELWENSDEPYRTNDLFIQDPPGSGFYVLQGRKDDILVHSNGENTSAGPLQLDIQTSSKIIAKVLALGHSKPCVSLLVEVHSEHDPSSDSTRREVWKTVQAVNDRYPGHSQIMESMIYILPGGEALPVTPKGNVKRKEAMKLYSSIIDNFYSSEEQVIPSNSSQTDVGNYIRNLLSSLSNVPVQEIHSWTTLYDLGINSRLALSLKVSLTADLKQSISLGTIFENPSISKLVDYFSHASSPVDTTRPPEQASIETVHRIISKLEAEFKSWPPRTSTIFPLAQKETVLLTGSSGSLGTSLLAVLSAHPHVDKIYAMVRGSNRAGKLRRTLAERGMDTSIIDEGKIEVVNFSMQDPLLGLDLEKYAELANMVTVVVQNAWKMDFNLGVEEFEGDCLRNTMSLLRLTQAGRPKRFVFTSSISACMGPGQTSPTVFEEPIGNDPTVALSTGYAQIERITQTATRILNLPVHLLRVGQMAGSTTTGHWNVNEMWPIMFATALHPSITSIPSFPSKLVDWIPVNIAAATISDIILSYSPLPIPAQNPSPPTTPVSDSGDRKAEYTVHNITNPHPISWSSLVDQLRDATGTDETTLPTISMKQWVARLNAVNTSPDEVPGLRLLQFFENMAGEEEMHKTFDSRKTQEISGALRGCGQFHWEWMRAYVECWRRLEFMR
ncbi:Acetyl-CoA synthetase-like protein [Glarea lozoyensis ATCC 20868]|uniref:Acetyl-CoA synthetase-like protein n=1 Tax=Glarea lozoyensis (strain ATCC 20868 / MF5171) TaxID=1116229 RepID=S3DHH4_GLAL2|nr:Acetyl-CoA synthetase-like protein [Glarea lozoyensis ATCC 20868]EPE31486.1 Acetyl-CoA synthetase-like protein [Glarea lozoyensis ATCC 20868]